MGTIQRAIAVLIIEDEPILRMMACDMVDEAGFMAVAATDTDDAIRILEERPDIQIVFTDIDMPNGVNGIKLAASIRDRWPPIEIIVTSGRYWESQLNLPKRAVFFGKPYRHESVIAEMRRMAVAH